MFSLRKQDKEFLSENIVKFLFKIDLWFISFLLALIEGESKLPLSSKYEEIDVFLLLLLLVLVLLESS